VTPTKVSTLALFALVALAGGYAAAKLFDLAADRNLPLPWSLPALMAVLALSILLWARGTKARLQGRPGTKPIDPLVVARSAAIAMATSRTGSLVGGFVVGVIGALLGGWNVPYVREQIASGAITAFMSALAVLSGLYLERICRVPPDARDTSWDETS
jgi:uncharacterized membrane protein YeaQ/YmgE (transglycosylase-associated protein family)